MPPVRINKFLAEQGVASRRGADALIQAGKVKVNGARAQMGMMLSETDRVEVNGKQLHIKPVVKQYFAFHKPVGILSSVDPNGKDTVATYLHLPPGVFHVGRLDVASSGLLLLTNDGVLAEAITHPRGNHEKEYIVQVDKKLSENNLEIMRKGMMILGAKTKEADVVQIDEQTFRIVLTEGKNRQIRRMCEKLGYNVKSLKRIRVMNIHLGSLPVGKMRELTKTEISGLKSDLEREH